MPGPGYLDYPPTQFVTPILTLTRFLLSAPYKFIVQGYAFYVHAELISHHSRTLNDNMTSALQETGKMELILDSCEKDTFSSFCGWLYYQRYTLMTSAYSNVSASRAFQGPMAGSHVTAIADSDDGSPDDQPLQSHTGSENTHLQLFLGQTKMLLFSQEYGIAALRQHTMLELEKIIEIFALHGEPTTGRINYVRHAFTNVGSAPELRDWIENYMVSTMERLLTENYFLKALSGTYTLPSTFLHAFAGHQDLWPQ